MHSCQTNNLVYFIACISIFVYEVQPQTLVREYWIPQEWQQNGLQDALLKGSYLNKAK